MSEKQPEKENEEPKRCKWTMYEESHNFPHYQGCRRNWYYRAYQLCPECGLKVEIVRTAAEGEE